MADSKRALDLYFLEGVVVLMISKVCLAYNVTHVNVSLIMLLLKMTMTIISKVCLARPGRRRGKLQPSGLECFSGHWKIPI